MGDYYPCNDCGKDCDKLGYDYCCERCTWGLDEIPEGWCDECDQDFIGANNVK
jgi:hypothetical protein